MNIKTQKDILNFPLASGNMYYEVEEEMRLYLEGDCQTGIRLKGGDYTHHTIQVLIPTYNY